MVMTIFKSTINLFSQLQKKILFCLIFFEITDMTVLMSIWQIQ
jgi:hypothetical protein